MMLPAPSAAPSTPPPRALVMPDAARALILAHVREALPDEACGLLTGRRDRRGFITVASVHPTENVATSNRTRRFEVDPAAHINLARHLRGSGLDIIGHFHSHPEGDARPSALDRETITDPRAIWVIAGVAGWDRSSFRLTAWSVWDWVPETGQGRFKPLAIIGQADEASAPTREDATRTAGAEPGTAVETAGEKMIGRPGEDPAPQHPEGRGAQP